MSTCINQERRGKYGEKSKHNQRYHVSGSLYTGKHTIELHHHRRQPRRYFHTNTIFTYPLPIKNVHDSAQLASVRTKIDQAHAANLYKPSETHIFTRTEAIAAGPFVPARPRFTLLLRQASINRKSPLISLVVKDAVREGYQEQGVLQALPGEVEKEKK